MLLSFWAGAIYAQNVELRHGYWFNGESFTQKERVYITQGVFTTDKPEKVDTVIDLSKKYVIPPFAEVHTHNLSSSYGLAQTIEQYIQEGTYYVQVLGCSHQGRLESLPSLNRPNSIDAVYANGGITSTLGHPFQIYEPLAMGFYVPAEQRRRFNEVKRSRKGLGDAYWFFDQVEEVDQYWDTLMRTKPDIIKIMLIEAENYAQHQGDSNRVGNKGISPEVAERVIQKAHQAGLKVYAHITMPGDFRIGLDLGVDVFAHMPGYVYGGTGNPATFALTPYDFQKAKAKGVAIIPTAYLALRRIPRRSDEEKKAALANILAFQSAFFEQALKYEIPMGLGSDDFGETLMKEVDYLHEHNLLTELQLLQMMSVSGPQLCFPDRKIGKLAVGYEGSLLVLSDNPLTDFNAVKRIETRIKQGVVLK